MPAVGIIGAGVVAQSVCGALVAAGMCERLLIASRSAGQAAALADDLDDMRTALGSPVRPYPAEVPELRDCVAVVIAVRARFTNTRSSDVRMGGAQANAPLIRALAAQLADYRGSVLVVTNPVDLMTRLFAEESGCRRAFGIGSSLDSARYRLTLARLLNVPAGEVAGHVIGEHGDAAVICASSTTVNRHPAPVPLQQVRNELKARPGRINAGIGRTRCGPAGAVVSTLRLVCGLEDGTTELCVSQGDVWLGMPVRFRSGRPQMSVPPLDAAEARQLEAARSKLRVAYGVTCGVPAQPLPSERN